MSEQPRNESAATAATTTGELREQIEHTRDELGRTVEALAAKADVKARAKEKTAAVREQASEHAALVGGQIRDTLDPVVEKAAHGAGQVRAAASAVRAKRTPMLAIGAVVVVFLLVRRNRRHK
ncbi:DUF3618 domain-containing protein [Streptomyces sp. NBC_01565]|uniref:DUF3618 domain-containing protein n=1 Tax=unclassified Streptomyces TaxID=2593676 RepID=UPI002251CD82|nr:DUF3618 domain-containing protein [Streptomyces sp. NBC_01565]MCX4539294.1 DUF3618 domain-containing protein [Streptomyces sp. NBC_01565]